MSRYLLLLISLVLLSAMPRLAQASTGPCELGLLAADLPEMEPFEAADPALGGPADPTICERIFRSEPPGPSGLSTVRSLVMMAPTTRQATADLAEYRALLVANGWAQGSAQQLGEEAFAFSGSDPGENIYSVQQLFRRGSVVAGRGNRAGPGRQPDRRSRSGPSDGRSPHPGSQGQSGSTAPAPLGLASSSGTDNGARCSAHTHTAARPEHSGWWAVWPDLARP